MAWPIRCHLWPPQYHLCQNEKDACTSREGYNPSPGRCSPSGFYSLHINMPAPKVGYNPPHLAAHPLPPLGFFYSLQMKGEMKDACTCPSYQVGYDPHHLAAHPLPPLAPQALLPLRPGRSAGTWRALLRMPPSCVARAARTHARTDEAVPQACRKGAALVKWCSGPGGRGGGGGVFAQAWRRTRSACLNPTGQPHPAPACASHTAPNTVAGTHVKTPHSPRMSCAPMRQRRPQPICSDTPQVGWVGWVRCGAVRCVGWGGVGWGGVRAHAAPRPCKAPLPARLPRT